jgi:hypothetical protein
LWDLHPRPPLSHTTRTLLTAPTQAPRGDAPTGVKQLAERKAVGLAEHSAVVPPRADAAVGFVGLDQLELGGVPAAATGLTRRCVPHGVSIVRTWRSELTA